LPEYVIRLEKITEAIWTIVLRNETWKPGTLAAAAAGRL
jgi:hypothetical protein